MRLASAFIIPSKQKIVAFTDDMLLNQLRRDGPKIEESFDRLCADDLVRLSSLLSKANGLVYSGLAIATQEGDELRAACAQLLLNAANSFAAAVAVLRMGYVLQPGIIIRSLLEAVSTTLHLIQHPKDLAAYQNHTLQSPKTIAAAKKALPPFGQLYGHFSDSFAHIGQLHKSITPIREYSERHEALEVNLRSLSIAAWLLYVTAELAFNELVAQPRYWHPVEQGYKYDPLDGEKEWMKNFFQLSMSGREDK
ncbi:MAG: hypothetical protein V4568_09790 [Pseudomonadota bacterium]